MTLTTVLDQLTKLTSRHFVLGAFVPVLVFGFLNGAVAYAQFDWFRARAAPQISALEWTFDVAAVFVALSVSAYVLWSLNVFLRAVLEGRYLTRDWWLGRRWRGGQETRRDKLRKERLEAMRQAREIESAAGSWIDRLTAAAQIGSDSRSGERRYGGEAEAAKVIERLRAHRNEGTLISKEEIEKAVAALAKELKRNDSQGTDPTKPTKIEEDWRELQVLIQHASQAWASREALCVSSLQTRFGTDAAVAPTALGNIAQSMHGYAYTRYNLDLETFWSRFQPLLQKHEGLFGALQDAKAQLDFLISSVFLSGLSTALWVAVLPVWTGSLALFLVIALGGPVVTLALYWTAVENYLGFGELVRTAVDLHRFELLDALHVARPTGLRNERVLWEALRGVSSLGVEWVDLSYEEGAGE